MNNEEELSMLIAQKKEIEEKIRTIKNAKTICGNAKFQIQRYTTNRPDDYIIMLSNPCHDPKYGFSWRTAIRSTDKEECIKAIDVLIKDLSGLKEKLKENENA